MRGNSALIDSTASTLVSNTERESYTALPFSSSWETYSELDPSAYE